MSRSPFDFVKTLPAIVAAIAILFVAITLFFLPEHYQIEKEVTVPRSPEKTWEWFVHPKEWSKRLSIVQSVEAYPPNIKGLGEEVQIEANFPGSGKLTSKIMITGWNQGKLVEDRHSGDWLNGQVLPIRNVLDRFEFLQEGPGKTRFVFRETFDVSGIFNKWFAYFYVRPAANRFLTEVLKEYRQSVEVRTPGSTRHG